MTSRRVETGGHGVDRATPVAFTFEGAPYEGLTGDTLASALLAGGVDVICPSPILGRPRGVFSAGVEEPCAFVEISTPRWEPIVPATAVELVEGLSAVGRPGVGRLPEGDAGVPQADHRHLHVETLVVGAGVAGLAVAREAAAAGDRVLLVDERHWLGGTAHTTDTVEGDPALAWVEAVASELDAAPDVRMMTRATALGVYDMGYVVVYERSRPVERVWHVRAGRVILATGAHERPVAFADDDRPGVMLASAAALYADRFGVLPGTRAVVFTTSHTGHRAAMELADAGLEVLALIDAGEGGPATDETRGRGIDVRSGWSVTGTDGDPRVSAVHATGPDGATDSFDADLLLVAGGWNPAVQLWRGIDGGLRYDETRACFLPDGDGPDWLRIVGAAAGEGLPSVTPRWFTPADDLSRHFVDLQRDSTVADVLEAVGMNLRSTEHVKRATYIGTAIDQGRTSGVLTAAIVNQAWGAGPGAQGPTNARPPYTPVPYAALAGRDRGPRLLDPVRTTPIHAWHVAHGAVFENVGQWKRPWYFPATGEELREAVHRECLAVRGAVGVMDASTLGKIELVGPDVGTFCDRLYTNRMSSVPVGGIRYGFMLGLDGMVFDDGVAMRLAEDRFLITTTTGGAAKVMDHVEEWLQTEWPELRVYATSVTEQWATIAVNGPRARDVLAAAGTDIALDRGGVPVHDLARGVRRGDAGAGRARELQRGARVRGQRRRLVRTRDVGGADGRRGADGDHPVRHRGDARASGGEGVRDRRTGHRRDRHAPRPRHVVDRERDQGRLHRAALALAAGHRPRRSQAPGGLVDARPGHGAARGNADRGRRHRVDPDADDRPRDVELPQPRAGALHRAGDGGAGARADRLHRVRTAHGTHDRGPGHGAGVLRPRGSPA